MKRLLRVSIITLILILLSFTTIFAHSGLTDSRGGHFDTRNSSYHYHCGGHPAHLHTDGVCPYGDNSITSNIISTEPHSISFDVIVLLIAHFATVIYVLYISFTEFSIFVFLKKLFITVLIHISIGLCVYYYEAANIVFSLIPIGLCIGLVFLPLFSSNDTDIFSKIFRAIIITFIKYLFLIFALIVYYQH